MRSNGRLAALGLFTALGFAVSAPSAGAAVITLTALVSDRGIDTLPRNGVFDSVFGNPSVVQITTPPVGDPSSEERTAIEFFLAMLPSGSTINSAVLQLSPQPGSMNLGFSAAEAAEVHGYAGNGAIEVADMMMVNLVGSLTGPTPNGAVSVAIATGFLQGLVSGGSPWAGLMFKGVDGPAAVTFNFAGTFGGIPQAQRPQLTIDYTPAVVPEPASLLLFVSGVGGVAWRRRWRCRDLNRFMQPHVPWGPSRFCRHQQAARTS